MKEKIAGAAGHEQQLFTPFSCQETEEKKNKKFIHLFVCIGGRARESEQLLTSNTELMAHPLVHSCLGCPVVE